MALEIGGDVRAPIILGRPFLSTTKAIIYIDSAKFVSQSRIKRRSFLSRIVSCNLLDIHRSHSCSKRTMTKKKNNRRRRKNKARQPQEESVNMINTLRSEYDHLLTSSFLAKKDDPGVPTIECTIWQRIFHKTFCDIRSGVNIVSKVTYKYLFGDEPLFPTYMQL